MDVVKMKKILKSEYGISSEEEFVSTVSKMVGVNIGIFTMSFERSINTDETKNKKMAIA